MTHLPQLLPPKIIRIDRIIQNTGRGVPYVQDYAEMDDGSKWEVPCIGNGNLWRKVNLSIGELQSSFEQYLIALTPTEVQNTTNEPSKTEHNPSKRS